MKYLGIYSGCVIRGQYTNKERFSVHYHHSTTHHGKEVKWYEVVEDDSPRPAKIDRHNMKDFHTFFTSEDY